MAKKAFLFNVDVEIDKVKKKELKDKLFDFPEIAKNRIKEIKDEGRNKLNKDKYSFAIAELICFYIDMRLMNFSGVFRSFNRMTYSIDRYEGITIYIQNDEFYNDISLYLAKHKIYTYSDFSCI